MHGDSCALAVSSGTEAEGRGGGVELGCTGVALCRAAAGDSDFTRGAA